MNNMLASKNKPDVLGTKKKIVFSYFYKGKVTSLYDQEPSNYTPTLI